MKISWQSDNFTVQNDNKFSSATTTVTTIKVITIKEYGFYS